jgi:hypothetical protein
MWVPTSLSARVDNSIFTDQPSSLLFFESLSDNPSAGDWGGIQVMGQAITNESGVRLTEVGNYLYGGGDDLDYSIRLTYVKIRHAGEVINQSPYGQL